LNPMILALNYLPSADLCATWTRNNLCDANGVLRNTTQGDFATFNQICIRYVIQLARLPNHAATMTWMQTNGVTAWNNRRTSDNIMGFNWAAAAPATGIESQGAAGGVALLNLLATPSVPIRPLLQKTKYNDENLSINRMNHGITVIQTQNGMRALDGSKIWRIRD